MPRFTNTHKMKLFLLQCFFLIGFSANAQTGGYETVDDAFLFLDEHFKGSTYIKQGDYWKDPVELHFFKKDFFSIFHFHGTILEKHYMEYNMEEMSKMIPLENPYGALYFRWKEIRSISLDIKAGNEYWLTIEGNLYDDDNNLIDTVRSLYVSDDDKAIQIKEALEYIVSEAKKQQ